MQGNLVKTFLFGALAASLVLNVMQYQASQEPKLEIELPGQSPYESLDLTPTQIRILNECGKDSCDAMEDLREQSARVTEELRVALSGPDFDQERVKDLADELCTLRNQEVDNNIATLLQVRDVLKPGQLRELYHLLYPDWQE